MSDRKTQKWPKLHWRWTTLLYLLLFAFVILFVSICFAALTTFFLLRIGVLPPLSMRGYPAFIISMLLVSLFTGLILTWRIGTYTLRPLQQMTEATREIAAGNFAVRLRPYGPEELRILAENFNMMAGELGSIETLRNDFVGNVSHEFKTPVVSIRGFSKLLKKDSLTDEQRDDYLDTIIAESERLTQLSSNILLLAKLENTERIIERETYRLDEQIRRAVVLLEPQISKKQLDIDARLESVEIVANQELLQHVWLNILNNAIKFTPENGRVEIVLTGDEQQAVVTISDTGIGMDAHTQKNLFDKFYQGDLSHATEGNGLGLSLVKRILDLSGGDISVISTIDCGSKFEVHIPKI